MNFEEAPSIIYARFGKIGYSGKMVKPTPVRSTKGISLPLFLSAVMCGFPSPAQDFVEARLDLTELLIKHPAATFFVRASGNSMAGAGINPGDLLIIDRAPTPTNGAIILAVVDGEFTVKQLKRTRSGQLFLVAANPDYPPIRITEEMQFEVWGVVTHIIHQVGQV